jgi:ABC-type transporter Mla subunit MlaD
VAEVRKKNLLGETYVDIQRGAAAGSIPSGGSIPIDHTITSTQIDEVLAVLDPQTVQRVQLLINGLGAATTNNGGNMNAQAVSLDQLLTSLNGPAVELGVRQGQIQSIVLELQRFYTVLANQRAQVRDEFGTWNQVMAQMAAQESAIGGTLQQADTLLQNLDTLVAGESGNIRTILAKLPPALTSTNGFLNQSNQIIAAIAPYRQYINDVFPALQTSFADTDANGQHFWSVFSATCTANGGPLPTGTCSQSSSQTQPSSYSTGSSGNLWGMYSSGGGR